MKQQGLSKGIWADFFFPFRRTVTFPLVTFENQHREKAEWVFGHCFLVMKEYLGEESAWWCNKKLCFSTANRSSWANTWLEAPLFCLWSWRRQSTQHFQSASVALGSLIANSIKSLFTTTISITLDSFVKVKASWAGQIPSWRQTIQYGDWHHCGLWNGLAFISWTCRSDWLLGEWKKTTITTKSHHKWTALMIF